MICPSCQADNVPDATFCFNCGHRFSAGAEASDAPPQKKGLAIASLVLGLLSLPTLGCLGVGAITAIILGIMALVKANRAPAEYGGQGLAIAGIATSALSFLVGIPLVGIIAAIAIPSLLQARVGANESATIGDIRTMISAELTYQASNGGYYDTPECLGKPDSCIPGYSGPVFLDATLASATTKSGYTRTFHSGPPAEPSVVAQGKISPSSTQSFAYVAVPAQPNRTGVRGFCGDSTGRICVTHDGIAPEIIDGQCDPNCTLLQ